MYIIKYHTYVVKIIPSDDTHRINVAIVVSVAATFNAVDKSENHS